MAGIFRYMISCSTNLKRVSVKIVLNSKFSSNKIISALTYSIISDHISLKGSTAIHQIKFPFILSRARTNQEPKLQPVYLPRARLEDLGCIRGSRKGEDSLSTLIKLVQNTTIIHRATFLHLNDLRRPTFLPLIIRGDDRPPTGEAHPVPKSPL